MSDQRPYTRHTAGALIEGVQRCVVCGLILTDHRNAAWIEAEGPPGCWAEGPVYNRGNWWLASAPEDEPIESHRP
jgi:hypothetical protein